MARFLLAVAALLLLVACRKEALASPLLQVNSLAVVRG